VNYLNGDRERGWLYQDELIDCSAWIAGNIKVLKNEEKYDAIILPI
jgi:hypothetical protein